MLTHRISRYFVLSVFILSLFVGLINFNDSAAVSTSIALRPNSTIASAWSPIGTANAGCTGNCSYVNEPSSAPDITNYVTSASGDATPVTDEYGLEDTTAGQTATTVTVRAYVARQGTLGSPQISLNLRIGGNLQTANTTTIVSAQNVFVWYEASYTGAWTQSELNAASMTVTRIGQFLGSSFRVATVETTATLQSPAQSQDTSRVYANANSLTPGTPLAATNTRADVVQNTQFRIRAGITVSDYAWNTGTWGPHANSYSLIYAQKTAASCAAQATGWGTVQVGTGAIQWFDNPAIANGAVISSYAQDPTTSGTKVYQVYRESNSLTNSTAIPVGNTGIWDFSLVSAGSTAPGTSFCFRVLKNNGADLTTYAIYPEVIITKDYGVGIVDASGIDVISPLVAFASSTVSTSQCSLQTATLGTSSQKIRINNDLITNGWNVSMAATGGPTALWTSGSNTYDFNDPSGSPAGCGDGGDADALAGQLRVNPTTQTVTPKAGCSTTGLSTGTDTKFSQGITDAITLSAATSSSSRFCYWDITNIPLEQRIPAATAAGNYSLDMTVTMTAL